MVATLVLRFLFFLLLAYCFFRLLGLRSFTREKQGDLQASERKNDTEEMVLDPHCYVYVSRSESLSRRGHYFCSEECARHYLA
jgi:Prokaryotic metallothionein